MKPMLAATVTDTATLPYPLLLSAKLDGVRCLIINGVAMSRSLKPIPNKHVQYLFGRQMFNGLDGELIIGDPAAQDVFNKTSSGVMSQDGEPEVTFNVFDDFRTAPGTIFEERLASVAERTVPKARHDSNLVMVSHNIVHHENHLLAREEAYLAAGYEGVMLRHLDGMYKFGRSTLREAWLMKLKRFADGEAIVTGFTELMHNANEATTNELGRTKRSGHKANLVGRGVLGALKVRDMETGIEFELGTGFTSDDRIRLWVWKDNELMGKIVKYKHQLTGVKDKPRFPVFLGFRDRSDL